MKTIPVLPRKQKVKRSWQVGGFLSLFVALGLCGYIFSRDHYQKEWVAEHIMLPNPLSHAATAKSLSEKSREIFRYSVIPGGVSSGEEIRRAAKSDLVVRDHYQGIDLNNIRKEPLQRNMLAYVSYRIDKKVYWTQEKVQLHKGETVLTDGKNLIRGRCGNRISETTMVSSTAPHPPSPAEFDIVESAPALSEGMGDSLPTGVKAITPRRVAMVPPVPLATSLVSPVGPVGATYPGTFAAAGLPLKYIIPAALAVGGGGATIGALSLTSQSHTVSNVVNTPPNTPSAPPPGTPPSAPPPPIGPPIAVTPEPVSDGLLLAAALGWLYYRKHRKNRQASA
jgi:hypothetical protein